MTLPLRVLGDRVLIKPDVMVNAPEQTDGGVYLATSLAAAVMGKDPTTSLHRGTVIAVGQPKHPLFLEAESLADRLRDYSDYSETSTRAEALRDAAGLLCDLVRRQPCVTVNDDVLFSHDAGQQVRLENDTYIICREHELLAVVSPEPAKISRAYNDPWVCPGGHDRGCDCLSCQHACVNCGI